MYLLMIHCDF
jgi:hypothetical protein